MASHQAGVIEAGQSVEWALGRGAIRAPQPASCCFHSKTDGHTGTPSGIRGQAHTRTGPPATLAHERVHK